MTDTGTGNMCLKCGRPLCDDGHCSVSPALCQCNQPTPCENCKRLQDEIEEWKSQFCFSFEKNMLSESKLDVYELVMKKCIKAMKGSNCNELHWLEEALKRGE